MTEILIHHVELAAAHAPAWGLLLVFTFMAIESSFIPFPSEVVMVPAGFLAARGELLLGIPLADAALAALVGTAGSITGALVNYYLAARLGVPFLERYGRYVGLPPAKLHRAQAIFRRYGAGATFFCRLVPAIRQLISIPAGLAGMPLPSFVLWTGLGAGIWVTVLTTIGYLVGQRTTGLTYEALVRGGLQMARENTFWLVPAAVAGLAAYVMVSNRIMRGRSAVAEVDTSG